MRTCEVTLESRSPYSQSKHYEVDKANNGKETPKDYEARTWRERMHVDDATGRVMIPPMAFKNAIAEAAKFLSIQIPGKGKSTYTKHFEAGVMVSEPLLLDVKKEDVLPEWQFVPSDGIRGSGKRVSKCFPLIPSWRGRVRFVILDQTITKDVFLHHLSEAGQFIGIGRFRPRNNGFYGRFAILESKWTD